MSSTSITAPHTKRLPNIPCEATCCTALKSIAKTATHTGGVQGGKGGDTLFGTGGGGSAAGDPGTGYGSGGGGTTWSAAGGGGDGASGFLTIEWSQSAQQQ